MNEASIIKELKKIPGFFSVYHKTTFECYRNAKSGEVQKVLVDISDAGPEAGLVRYACNATSEDGKVATGNGGPSIDVALATTHWYDLDR